MKKLNLDGLDLSNLVMLLIKKCKSNLGRASNPTINSFRLKTWRSKEILLSKWSRFNNFKLKLGIALKEVRGFIVQYKKCLRIRSNTNRKYLQKKRMQQNHHLEFIQNLMESQKGVLLTVNDVRLKLKEEFNEVSIISKRTMRRVMKRDLKMS